MPRGVRAGTGRIALVPKELYVSTRVLRTGRSARVDEADLEAIGRPDADVLRLRGFLHQVGSPVVVEGRLWGAMTLNSQEALPPDVDQRLVSFTELVATAMADAESQSELAASAGVSSQPRRTPGAGSNATSTTASSSSSSPSAWSSESWNPPSRLVALKPQVAGVTSGLRGAIDDLREISRGSPGDRLARQGSALR